MSEPPVWETPNDLDALEAHVAASNYIGVVEERLFRNLIAEVRRLRAIESKVLDLAAAFEVSGSSWHKGTIAAAVRKTLEPR